MNLHDTIAAGFPIVAHNDLAMLELVRSVERRGYIYLVVRAVELEPGGARVRQIRQHTIRFVRAGESAPRVERYLDALARVLERVLGNPQFAGAHALTVFDACPLAAAPANGHATASAFAN